MQMLKGLGNFIRDVAYETYKDGMENSNEQQWRRAFARSEKLQAVAKILDPKGDYPFVDRYEDESVPEDV
jgi:hypothetical protein